MNINIKGTNITLVPDVKDYIEKKINSLDKFFSPDELNNVNALFEVAKRGGQKSGDIFHADCLIKHHGDEFYASSDKEDILQAVDEIRDILYREIQRSKNKKWAVFYRGARKMKDMMRGISNFRPWKK